VAPLDKSLFERKERGEGRAAIGAGAIRLELVTCATKMNLWIGPGRTLHAPMIFVAFKIEPPFRFQQAQKSFLAGWLAAPEALQGGWERDFRGSIPPIY